MRTLRKSIGAICRAVAPWPGGKRLRLALLVGGGLLVPLVGVVPASAGIPCKSDPILVVDGAAAHVVTTLWADPSLIREMDYQVTVPSGALIGRITLTVGLGFPEKVSYVFSPSQSWGSIQVAATAVTQDGVPPFPVTVQVSSLLAGSSTASGTSAAAVTASLNGMLML